MVVFFVCKQTLDNIDSNGGKLRHQLFAYAQILQLLTRRNFHRESGKEMLNFCRRSAEGKCCKESGEDNKEPLRTLIIQDEILKGTNSLDKLNGSRKFLEAIAKQPVSGISATHDLELSKM